MIRIQNLVKDYHVPGGVKRVLDNVNFEVRAGERVAVLGRNGAGKSTLVRIIGGVEHATSGVIERTMTMSWPLGLSGGLQGSLTGIDTIKFIARIYDKPIRELRGVRRGFFGARKLPASPDQDVFVGDESQARVRSVARDRLRLLPSSTRSSSSAMPVFTNGADTRSSNAVLIAPCYSCRTTRPS